jgi:hypothetical protein
MPATLKGNFYFRLTSNGNLTGEFSNQYSKRAFTESADRVREPSSPTDSRFCGEYISTWQEGEGNDSASHIALLSNLRIAPHINGGPKFIVEWRGFGSDGPNFDGEAILAEDLLVGNYVQLV